MRMGIIILVTVLIASGSFAQFRPFQRKAAELKTARETLEAPPGEPVDELDVNELLLQRRELAGKVVELTFDRVIDLKQIGDGYTARVMFETPRMAEGLTLIIPAEGLKFFEPLADHKGTLRETVYVQVLTSNAAKALGTRYSKNKPEGERYSW